MCQKSMTGMDVLFMLGLFGMFILSSILLLMYLDGYWTQERCKERRNRNSFVAIDERFRRG